MKYIPVQIAQSSAGRNKNTESSDGSYLENWFIESRPPSSKVPAVLLPTPGSVPYATLSGIPLAGITSNEIRYIVTTTGFYSLSLDAVPTLIGAVSFSAARVTIAENGTDIVFCGREGYKYNPTDGLSQFTVDDGYLPCEFVAYLDSYFVFLAADTQKYFVSQINSTEIDATEISSAESIPDRLQAMVVTNRTIVLFGTGSTEQHYNSQGFDFPFSRQPGSYIETGIGAKYSAAAYKNNAAWVGEDRIVYRLAGGQAVPISDHDVEAALALEKGSISDAFGFMYSDKGHVFYQLTLPTQNQTWDYDFITKLWHNRSHSTHGRHHANFYMFCSCIGKHLIGDFQAPEIYQWTTDAYADSGNYIHREMVAPIINNGEGRYSINSIAVDLKKGVGTIQEPDPRLFISMSKDNKATWPIQRDVSMGKLGETKGRVKSDQWGQARDAHIRIECNSKVDAVINGVLIR